MKGSSVFPVRKGDEREQKGVPGKKIRGKGARSALPVGDANEKKMQDSHTVHLQLNQLASR